MQKSSGVCKKKKKDEWGIDPFTKTIVERVFDDGTKGAGKILIKLRELSNPHLKRKKTTDPLVHNPNYIAGIKLPSRSQITNHIRVYKSKKNGGAYFNYADLFKWVKILY